MRLLYISSSHGRGMDLALSNVNCSINVMPLWLPHGRVGTIHRLVDNEKTKICSFDPDFIIIHLGHNDVNHHPQENPHPTSVLVMLDGVVELVDRLKALVPLAIVFFSAIFPRCSTPSFVNESCRRYNQLAHKIVPSSKKKGLEVIKSPSELWTSRTRGNKDFYMHDGLHLNEEGKRAVATKWLDTIFYMYYY